MDIFFTTTAWTGTPEIHEPHKCTELVWVDPDELLPDALDFTGQAWRDTNVGQVFCEFGFAETVAAVRNDT